MMRRGHWTCHNMETLKYVVTMGKVGQEERQRREKIHVGLASWHEASVADAWQDRRLSTAMMSCMNYFFSCVIKEIQKLKIII